MNIICAVDKNWAIGLNGNLLVSIPRDKKYFRDETLGKTIIMGRKTFEDLPGMAALYGRKNIVLSRDESFNPEDTIVLRDLKECLDYIKKEEIPDEEVFIIGGESIYSQFLPYCDIAHITYIDYEYKADRYMHNLDKDSNWQLVLESDEETYFDLVYYFRLYKRRNNI